MFIPSPLSGRDPAARKKMRERALRLICIVGATVSTAVFMLGTLPASAQTADVETRSVLVRTDDLNLSRPAGQKTLQSRIRSAEHEICGNGFGRTEPPGAQAACMRSLQRSTTRVAKSD